MFFKVKPLLEVTNNEEKISGMEQELKQVADRFDKLKLDRDDLEKTHLRVLEEKNQLAEQLQIEAEQFAEADEVKV